MNTLWEADVVVFKAHITTGPGGKVLDMFWIYDNRCELPENHRHVAEKSITTMALQICHVYTCCGTRHVQIITFCCSRTADGAKGRGL